METYVIIADSESCADIYYATGFFAPDSFIFIRIGDEKIMILSDLEIDRAREVTRGRVDTIVSSSVLEKRIKEKTGDLNVSLALLYLGERGVTSVTVPVYFPVYYADILRQCGIEVIVKKNPFFAEREIKTPQEIEYITDAVFATEGAMAHAAGILAESLVRGDRLLYGDRFLTSGILKREINIFLMEKDFLAEHTIVSNGMDCCQPHNTGNGFLRPHEPVIIDIFPRSSTTGYFADMTRTFVKGTPSAMLEKAWNAVLKGQEIAFENIRAGVNGKDIHQMIEKYFESEGFITGVANGAQQGFFHGTGHGVGLQIHEAPRIGKADNELKENSVVTVEPGLYYPEFGGVRIEDIVIVEKNSCKNLNTYTKILRLS